jgi:hypothetical protein
MRCQAAHGVDEALAKKAANLFHFLVLGCGTGLKPDVIHIAADSDLTSVKHVIGLALYPCESDHRIIQRRATAIYPQVQNSATAEYQVRTIKPILVDPSAEVRDHLPKLNQSTLTLCGISPHCL